MSAPEQIWIVEVEESISRQEFSELFAGYCADDLDGYAECYETKAVEYIRADLAPQWQDIATAPKDGTFILAFGNGVAIHNCHYIAEWSEGDGWICSYSDVDVTPSHWMPLPTPPEPTQ